MPVLNGPHLAELTVKTYQKMRSDEEAELFFKTVSKKALDYPFISSSRLHYHVKEKGQTMDLSIITFKLKDIAIVQKNIIPPLRNNTSGNNILKNSILSYHQLKVVSISRYFHSIPQNQAAPAKHHS